MAACGAILKAEPQRRARRCHGAALLLLLVAGLGALADAQLLQPRNDIQPQNDTGICKSMDIRNTLDTFKRLSGCRVVEGFVQILLFDKVNETQLAEISFPLLTEITDYLLLYRVNGLRSIGQLFPNLAVIRGQSKFFTYSLVVFEMSSLQEIGLYSLTDITSGYIRIDKNPSLCFVESIDWNLIAPGYRDNFIKSIKPENECPVCPGDENVDEIDGKTLQIKPCPKSTISNSNKHLCWNRQHCQKICPPGCHTCDAHNKCCNRNCLGGCSVDNPYECTVCRNVTIGYGNKRTCNTSCPDNLYKYLDRRCVTKEECRKMRRPIDLQQRHQTDFPYRLHNDTCVLQCPTDMNYGKDRCEPCEGRCKKECDGFNIDNINVMNQLRGCTHIKSSLEIQIRGGKNVVSELEENLGMIEEIDGYLKIVRSFPLVSLNFLKSLKRIRGNNLESSKYVIVVLDNQNLQELWDWKNGTRKIKIDRGRLFFHFNPKLCINQIELLQKQAGLNSFNELEVAPNSNGDKVACNVEELNVRIESIESNAVILKWHKFELYDQRKLLGYIVYWIEAPYENVTLYDGRDACGGDGWNVLDVQIVDESEFITQALTLLKAYTRYAFYVKTYTIATERKGAQSKLYYIRTKASIPSHPLNLKVTNQTSHTLSLSWKPPVPPKGRITKYRVSIKKQNRSLYSDLNDRDYCTLASLQKHTILPNLVSSLNPTTSSDSSNGNCTCEDNKSTISTLNEDEELSRIKFEDDLQNQVYIKRTDNSNQRKKRNIADKPITNVTENGTLFWETYSILTSQTNVELTNLRHSTTYIIYVEACREMEANDSNEGPCGKSSNEIAITLSKFGADNIRGLQATSNNTAIVLRWKEPEDPNGIIFTYSIQYKQIENENSKPTLECISHSQFLNRSRTHILTTHYPGNYSIRVFATTSAGNGPYSSTVYVYINEPTTHTPLIIVITFLLIIFLGAFIGFMYYKKLKADKENMRLIPSVNPIYVPSVYVPDDWEVPRKKIEMLRELGQGSFGMVYEGIACDIRGKTQIKCAVKTVNEHATNRERLEFLNEASVMKAFDTAHVVRLLGVVSLGQPTLVIMELMANGDLKSYLRTHRPDTELFEITRQPPSLRQILQMAIEIADGMAYLSAKKFVHRDLAARNCMVAEDLTVKIGDFGMTRDIYETDYYRKVLLQVSYKGRQKNGHGDFVAKGTKGLLPVRWMAPESLKDGKFDSGSDVWSYGVVLWEMATLASQPYQGLSNDQVLRYVIDGGVMERPENCPDKLYHLMRLCWQHKPAARPSFVQLCRLLLEDAGARFAQASFYHSTAGAEARALRPSPPVGAPLAGDLSDSGSEDDRAGDAFIRPSRHVQFPSAPADGREVTANGFAGCPTNGAATTQC